MSRCSKPDPKGAMIPGSQAAPKHLIHTVSQLGKPGCQWSFGKRTGTTFGKNDTPAPDQYTIASKIGTGPKHIISQRLADQTGKSRRENPGPAAYHTNDASKIRVNTPPSYSLSGRTFTSKPNEFPGPDRYRPQTAPSNLGCSLSGRHAEASRLKTPGPGAYMPAKEATMSSPPSYSIRSRTGNGFIGAAGGKRQGRKGATAGAQGSPGPAAYNIGNVVAHKRRNPAYSMGTRLRGLKSDATPGPDAYCIRSPMGQKKSY